MSFENPTKLSIGMKGDLSGRHYRVAGRVVMGVEEGGETYYWNEFNLLNDAGESATLVFEETGRGAEWRLFLMFEPEYPMSAQEAAYKRVGDPLNLEGTPVRVTLVDKSRVYFIEGQAPEGVEVDDVAYYFNAESGDTMQVVSWTGNEVEFYRGLTLQRGMVNIAFGIRESFRSTTPRRDAAFAALSTSYVDDDDGNTIPSVILKICLGIIVVLIILTTFDPSCVPRRQQPAIVKTVALDSPLKMGALIKIKEKSYRVTRHAAVDIAQVGFTFKRHEYDLTDDSDQKKLLVYGSLPRKKDWVLFSQVESNELTPQKAGVLRLGDKATFSGIPVRIEEIFRSTISLEEPPNLDASVFNPKVLYGFSGKNSLAVFLARWNANGIAAYRGERLAEKELNIIINPSTPH